MTQPSKLGVSGRIAALFQSAQITPLLALVGRTQQIVFILHQLALAGRIPRVPMFVDSPLSVNATEIFRLHPECFNEATYRFLREKENPE